MNYRKLSFEDLKINKKEETVNEEEEKKQEGEALKGVEGEKKDGASL